MCAAQAAPSPHPTRVINSCFFPLGFLPKRPYLYRAPLKAPPAPFRRALICACSRMHAHDCMRSWGGLCELHDHVALPTDPPDAPGRLRSVAGVHSTCSQLTSCSLHVVAALRTALRVGALRPLQTLSADPWHELSRPAKRELLIRPSAALATASLCGFHPEVQSG